MITIYGCSTRRVISPVSDSTVLSSRLVQRIGYSGRAGPGPERPRWPGCAGGTGWRAARPQSGWSPGCCGRECEARDSGTGCCGGLRRWRRRTGSASGRRRDASRGPQRAGFADRKRCSRVGTVSASSRDRSPISPVNTTKEHGVHVRAGAEQVSGKAGSEPDQRAEARGAHGADFRPVVLRSVCRPVTCAKCNPALSRGSPREPGYQGGCGLARTRSLRLFRRRGAPDPGQVQRKHGYGSGPGSTSISLQLLRGDARRGHSVDRQQSSNRLSSLDISRTR